MNNNNMEYCETLLERSLNGEREALKELMSIAGAGDAKAQYYLALYYEKTRGKDDSDCQYWIKKAVGNGYEAAKSYVIKEELVTTLDVNATKSKEDSLLKLFFMRFSFMGRTGQFEYFICLILLFALDVIIALKIEDSAIQNLLFLVVNWFFLSQTARRFHDFGESGWWALLPFSWIWALFQSTENVNDSNNSSNEISSMTEQDTKNRLNQIAFSADKWDGSADSLPIMEEETEN